MQDSVKYLVKGNLVWHYNKVWRIYFWKTEAADTVIFWPVWVNLKKYTGAYISYNAVALFMLPQLFQTPHIRFFCF